MATVPINTTSIVLSSLMSLMKKNESSNLYQKWLHHHLREIAQDKRTGAACFKGYGELRDMGVEKKENQAYVAIHNINDIEKVHENKMDIDGLGF